MKHLQKFKLTYQNGKEIKKEEQGDSRSVVDSAADDLTIDSEHAVKQVKAEKSPKVKSFMVWEEVPNPKAKKQAPAKKEAKEEK